MPFNQKLQKFNAKINTVTIGSGDKTVTIGGDSTYPFYSFDAPSENTPKIGVEISDMGLENVVSEGIKAYYDGASTIGEMAKKAAAMEGADFVALILEGGDPNGVNKSVDELIAVVKDVADSIDAPLVVEGCKNVEKDAELLPKVAEALQGRNVLILSEKEENYTIAAHHLGTELDARRQGCGVTVLLRKKQGFLLHRQTGVDLAEDRAVLAAVKKDAALDGVLPVHHIVPAIAEADLRLVDDVLVEVPGDQLHPLALHAPLVEFAGIDQLAAVDDRKLVRRVDTNESVVVVQAHRISSLILQMYFSASSKISATCCFRFGMVSRLGLKVKLYSNRWIMA